MAIADRLRDAARPTNTIVEAREPSIGRPEDLHRANPSPPPGAPSGAAKEGKKAAYQSEPEHIAKAYYVEEKAGERSYYDDYKKSAVAMRATDSTISSKREDMNTVRAMVDIAAARGWQSIDVAGSKEFKREAWIEAAARGIEAKGYKPSDPDRQEADKRRNERGYENEVRGPAPSNPATPAAPITPNNPDPSPADPARQLATTRTTVGMEQPGTGTPVAAKGEPDKAAPVMDAAKAEPGKTAPAVDAAKVEPGQAAPAAASKDASDKPAPDKAGEAQPSLKDNQRTVREAQKELSPDGRTIFAAMSEKIDREMTRYAAEGKAQIKAFAANELVMKERKEGPIVLSAEQRQALAAPEPARSAPAQAAPEQTRRVEPEAPRRTLGR
ncbi:Hypothetical protein RMHFA_05714 (plasmid) [Roseomonas mucosa]|uniref:LPD7 domain-containing protein n=1 Tax=Roseomonas mucosa TaxID=207340 RepID=UPI00224551AC|nr:LPD7 domain-containing protein [Roseomonas mucosa]UZO95019.1 Hypothetical protein RMHFA_05714 [Roseomonas mucosa]